MPILYDHLLRRSQDFIFNPTNLKIYKASIGLLFALPPPYKTCPDRIGLADFDSAMLRITNQYTVTLAWLCQYRQCVTLILPCPHLLGYDNQQPIAPSVVNTGYHSHLPSAHMVRTERYKPATVIKRVRTGRPFCCAPCPQPFPVHRTFIRRFILLSQKSFNVFSFTALIIIALPPPTRLVINGIVLSAIHAMARHVCLFPRTLHLYALRFTHG